MKPENLSLITELRHELHRHPELSMREHRTKERLQVFLRAHTSLKIIDRGEWFYAVKEGSRDTCCNLGNGSNRNGAGNGKWNGKNGAAGRRVALRADMDALPVPEGIDLPYASENDGISHKCGHDGHCAVLCGAALELDQMPLPAETTVFFLFQPGEETGEGAFRCLPLIKEAGIEEIYAFHNLSGFPEGSIVCREGLTQPASQGLTIRMHGKVTHASAPEKGLNPVGAIARTALFSQKLNALHQPRAFSTITGMNAGTCDFGLAAGDGALFLTLRGEDEGTMKEMTEAIISFAKEEAENAGLTIETSISDAFPETRNTSAGTAKVLACASGLSLPICPMDQIWRASEDFGHYLKHCEGAMFYVGNGEAYPPVHTGAYDFNDRILEPAVEMMKALAIMLR